MSPAFFDITLTVEDTWSAGFQQVFILATDDLSSLIQDDLPDRNGIDDIAITASLIDIDGGVLGQAGATHLHAHRQHPSLQGHRLGVLSAGDQGSYYDKFLSA